MPPTATLRDARRTFQFFVDDAVIDHFGPQLGPYGLAVYLALARRAKQGSAFPSVKKLAADTGMSKRSVIRAIQSLEELSLIHKQSRVDEDGDPTSNLYTLLDLSSYHTVGSAPQSPGSAPQSLPGDSQSLGVVPHSHYPSDSQAPKGFSLKEAHSEGINPSVSPLQGETTHTKDKPVQIQGRRSTKKAAPPSADLQGSLAAEILTPTLFAWAKEHVPTLDPAYEFERFLAHARAKGCQYADMGAAFQSWLLHPLTQSQPAKPKASLEERFAESDAATRRFLEEDSDGTTGENPFFSAAQGSGTHVQRPLGRPTPTGLLAGALGALYD